MKSLPTPFLAAEIRSANAVAFLSIADTFFLMFAGNSFSSKGKSTETIQQRASVLPSQKISLADVFIFIQAWTANQQPAFLSTWLSTSALSVRLEGHLEDGAVISMLKREGKAVHSTMGLIKNRCYLGNGDTDCCPPFYLSRKKSKGVFNNLKTSLKGT